MRHLMCLLCLLGMALAADDSLKPEAQYSGLIGLCVARPGDREPIAEPVRVLRSQEEFESFLSRIPKNSFGERVMGDDGVPSKDPLLHRGPIDWSRSMAIVAVTPEFNGRIAIQSVSRELKVRVERVRGRPELAAPELMGRYSLWLVPRVAGAPVEVAVP